MYVTLLGGECMLRCWRRGVYVTLLEGGECMLRCWKEVSVGYVVRRRGVYVTLLEGGECMLRC